MKSDVGAKNKFGNERGTTTLDFVFALLMAFGFSVIFFSLAMALSFVEVTQYIAFASSRAYYAAHESVALQTDLGNRKYEELLETPIFKRMFTMGWFKLSSPQFGSFDADYPVPDDRSIYTGVRLPMDAEILRLQLPFLGATSTNNSTGRAVVNSYLGREVSTEECRDNFNRMRANYIRQLHGSYQQTPTMAFLITDNGC